MFNFKISTLGMVVSACLALTTVVVIVTSVMTVREVNNIGTYWRDFESGPAKKMKHLQELNAAIGYGGMIHQFKNYILRQDRPRIVKIQTKVRAATVAIIAYRSIGVDAEEDAALKTISATIAQYADALTMTEKMAGKGPQAVNRMIAIKDGPALEAITVLSKELVKLRQKSSQSVYGAVNRLSNFSVFVAVTVGLMLTFLLIFMFWFTSLRLGRPLRAMVNAMSQLAGGDHQIEVPASGRRDEIGEMSSAVQVFKDNAIERIALEIQQKQATKQAEQEKQELMQNLADDFDSSVGGIINTVSAASAELNSTAQSMTSISEQTSNRANAVATASEHASSNVQTVASAAEEMSASISEINNQVIEAANISKQAVENVRKTSLQMETLAQTASKVGEVVSMISDIAEQTNLLALNATIESARAGEAGKGFAVVASEVKTLANETAKATEEIATHIQQIQAATKDAVTSIDEIGTVVNQLEESSTMIAAAMEEQGVTTMEISRNVQEAASGTAEVSTSIASVTQASQEAGAASGEVMSAAGELSQQSELMKTKVEQFLAQVRAA